MRKTIDSAGLKLVIPSPLSEEIVQIVSGAIKKYEEAAILLDYGNRAQVNLLEEEIIQASILTWKCVS